MSIELRGIQKRYGDHLVVDRFTLDIQSGELFVLLGGSGSGKSTVLRMIAGLAFPNRGSIHLMGRDVTNLKPQARNVGFVFQQYSLFRHMKIAENIEFGLKVRGVPEAERRKRSAELLDLVGLGGLGQRYPAQLSGGQQQRVALARALAYKPEVLLLDEPFGALDVRIRAQLRENLRDIQQQLGVTAIMVTHDQEEAFELGDRIGVVEQGRLIEVGTPRDLYLRPKSELVATFLGGGNVLVGRAKDGAIRLGSVTLPFPDAAPRHDDGAPVRVLLRPEWMEYRPQCPGHGEGISLGKARLAKSLFLGGARRMRFEHDGLVGARPIGRAARYGNPSAALEVSGLTNPLDNTVNPAPEQWLVARHYHVLDPIGLRILACFDGQSFDEFVGAWASLLCRASKGSLTALTIVKSRSSPEEVKALQDRTKRRLSDVPKVEWKTRQGSKFNEVLFEAQEGDFDVVITARPRGLEAHNPTLGPTVTRVLEQARLPVIVAQELPNDLKRVLVCTRGGEPGKEAVRFGGRIARQTQASIEVFHARSQGQSPEEAARVERHMSRAITFLSSLGLDAKAALSREPVAENILVAIDAAPYDLIVVGAPGPVDGSKRPARNTTAEVVRSSGRAVLIVPIPPEE